jgi:hypothetical protein
VVTELKKVSASSRRGGELVRQAFTGLGDAHVVELDALALGALLAVPVGELEARLRGAAGFAEQTVVAVEAVEHGLRDVDGAGVGEFREHGTALNPRHWFRRWCRRPSPRAGSA